MKVPKPKIIRFGLSTILLMFAGLQINDSDPWVWILVYGMVAALGMVGSSAQNPVRIGVSLLYVGLAWWCFPTEYHGVGQMDGLRPEIEQAREAFGLIIAAGINALNVWLFIVDESVRTQTRTKYDDE